MSLNKKVIFFILTIILLASAVRLYNPTFRSLWGDEVDSLFKTYNFAAHNYHFEKTGVIETVTTPIVEPIKGSHLPSYYVLLSVWTRIFGIGEYSLRFLSIILGILAVPIIFLLAKDLFDEKTALISAFLLVISGPAVFFSQEIRPYSFMLLFSLLSAYYFWQLAKGDRSRLNLIIYTTTTFLLVLAHPFGSLALAAQFVYLLVVAWKEKKFAESYQLFFIQVGIGISVLPLYALVVYPAVKGLLTVGVDMAYSVFPAYLKLLLFFFVLSLGETVAPWNFLVVVPAGIVFAYLFLRSLKDWSENNVFFVLMLCLFPVLFAVLFLKFTMPKYLIITLPFYLLLIGRSISFLPSRNIHYLCLGTIIVLQLISVKNYFTLNEYHNSNQLEPWREISRVIKNQYQAGDVIVVSAYDVNFRLLQYYLNITEKANYNIVRADLDDLGELSQERVWLVTHIQDRRKNLEGIIKKLRDKIARTYVLKRKYTYIPYEATLVSKLPIKRHEPGQSRIKIELFVRK